MKAKTIEGIDEMLRQKVKSTQAYYRMLKKELEEKYDSEWLNNCLTSAEAKSLKGARDDYCYWNELYNDFKNHDW